MINLKVIQCIIKCGLSLKSKLFYKKVFIKQNRCTKLHVLHIFLELTTLSYNDVFVIKNANKTFENKVQGIFTVLIKNI